MFRAKDRYSGMPYLNEWLLYQQGGASDMTSTGTGVSAAEAHQQSRCQWFNEQDAHLHHARRFQAASPLSYFKWSKADNPHDHGLGLGPPHDGIHPLNNHLHRSISNISNNSNNNNNHNNNGNNNNHNNNANGPDLGGGGGGGGVNYARTTSSGSLSGPPTPTGGLVGGNFPGGPNTPLVVPHPVKPPGSRSGGIKTYQCKICDQVFSTKSDLLIHCQQIHKQDPKPYKCPTCSKSFASSSCLSQHSRIHTGLKPYRCEICERKFTQLSHLQQHIRTHTGEKPYKCMHPGCGKAFSQLSSLQSHSRSHMTDRPFRCNSCYKCYADEQSLREHIPKHSDTKHLKTHICHICGKSYTQETYLSRHMAKHAQADMQAGKHHDLMTGLSSPNSSSRPIKQEPMDLADPREAYHRLLSASADHRHLLSGPLSGPLSSGSSGAGGGPGPLPLPTPPHPTTSTPSNHNSASMSNNSQHPSASPPDRSPPSDLSMNGGGGGGGGGGNSGNLQDNGSLGGGKSSDGAAGGNIGGVGGSAGGSTSAFMPLSPFGNAVSSAAGPGSYYSPSLSHHHGGMNPSMPHLPSMSSSRYFPYDPIGPFGRKSSSSASPSPSPAAMLGGLGDSALSGGGLPGSIGGMGVGGGAADHRNFAANMHSGLSSMPRESIANSLLSLQHIKNYAASSQGQMPGFGHAGTRLAWPSLDID